jgi:hypothetical protein
MQPPNAVSIQLIDPIGLSIRQCFFDIMIKLIKKFTRGLYGPAALTAETSA